VFSDAPLKPPRPQGERASSASATASSRGWEAAYGYFGVNAMYALVARRHMHVYGTTQDHLGAVAVAQRRWANLNPAAQLHEQPLSLADYRRFALDRRAVPPLRLLPRLERRPRRHRHERERARDRRSRPSTSRGWRRAISAAIRRDTLASGAVLAREPAFQMAGVTRARTSTCRALRLLHLHRAGDARGLRLLRQGRGRSVRRGARHRPGGRLAVNTAAGSSSSFYMWGMTPVSEASSRCAARAAQRQVAKHDVALVSGNGGVLSTHSTLILRGSPHERAPAGGRQAAPQITPEMAPFCEAARRHSSSCSAAAAAAPVASRRATSAASASRARPTWAPVSGRGTIFSFALMHQVYHPGFAAEVPYAVVVIALEEGGRVLSNLSTARSATSPSACRSTSCSRTSRPR
jgi:hypothetical protein